MGVTVTTGTASTYVALATTTLSSAVNSITISSIPTTYTDLVVVLNGTSSNPTGVSFQVGNGTVDTGSNYSYTELYGTGSATSGARAANQTSGSTGSFYTTQSLNVANFMNYSNTSTGKNIVTRGSNAGNQIDSLANWWRSTSAINIIKFMVNGGYTFSVGTTLTIYGIKAA